MDVHTVESAAAAASPCPSPSAARNGRFTQDWLSSEKCDDVQLKNENKILRIQDKVFQSTSVLTLLCSDSADLFHSNFFWIKKFGTVATVRFIQACIAMSNIIYHCFGLVQEL